MKTTIIMILVMFLSCQLYSQQGWLYQNSNLNHNQVGSIGAIYPMNKDTVFIIADSAIFLKTYDGGTNWISQNTGFTALFSDLSFCNIDTGYAVGQNGTIIKTIDRGTNWSSLTSGTNKDLFSISTEDPNNLWAVGDSGVILNSTDHGTTWLKNDSLTTKRLNSICFRNSNIGFIAGNNGCLYSTSNGGVNWDTLTAATSKDLFSITITDNFVYLLAGSVYDNFYNSDELFKSNDNINWTSNYFAMYQNPSKMYFQNDSLGFTITSNMTTNSESVISIDKTTDYGQNWASSFSIWNAPYVTGIAYSDIIFITDSIGYALSGNNIFKTTDGGVLVNIKELRNSNNLTIYPNPLSLEKLNIKISNPDLKEFSIEIFDINGEQILSNSDWKNTKSINISNLNSGVYFVKLLHKENIIDVKKFVKIK